MKILKKTVFMSTLLSGALCLSACSDDNPLLKAPYLAHYQERFVGYIKESEKLNHAPTCQGAFCYHPSKEYQTRVANNVECPDYFADPASHKKDKVRCEAWLGPMHRSLQRNQAHYAEVYQLPYETITEENIHDVEFWAAMVAAMNEAKVRESQ